ncbi:TIGR04219 family outer membrane beta-barrel protein [Acinetobacter lactucae]|nr:TIGR04219 family outer membrane beta-barrel protein [Acinetobacter lactucae]
MDAQMKILKISLLTLGMGLSGFAQADFVGVKGEVGYWFYDGKANMSSQFPDDQDLDQKGSAQLSLAVEHPIPFIPNAKIRYVNLDTETKSETLGQANYKVDLDHSDFILYYELLDNIVSVDAGLGATVLNGDITTYTGKRVDIDKTYPIAYLSGEVKLPFTGLSAKGEATYTNFDDARITDALAEVKYKFADNLLIDLGLTAGYRVLNIDLDDYDNNDLKFEFKGPYVGLEAHF